MKPITLYGIKYPQSKRAPLLFIACFGLCEYEAWATFFKQTHHKGSLDEAKRAYKAIGYRCVRIDGECHEID